MLNGWRARGGYIDVLGAIPVGSCVVLGFWSVIVGYTLSMSVMLWWIALHMLWSPRRSDRRDVKVGSAVVIVMSLGVEMMRIEGVVCSHGNGGHVCGTYLAVLVTLGCL